jgi:hypothetical protein
MLQQLINVSLQFLTEVVLISDKVNNLLREVGIIFYPADEVKIEDSRHSIIERHQDKHNSNHGPNINPLGEVSNERKDDANHNHHQHSKPITDIHGALVKSRLRFES